MKTEARSGIIWALLAAGAVAAAFLLSRFAFFGLHLMSQWPFILFVFGLTVILVSAIFDGRKIMLCTPVGYILGFAAGMLFNWDTYHPGRGPGVYTNNPKLPTNYLP